MQKASHGGEGKTAVKHWDLSVCLCAFLRFHTLLLEPDGKAKLDRLYYQSPFCIYAANQYIYILYIYIYTYINIYIYIDIYIYNIYIYITISKYIYIYYILYILYILYIYIYIYNIVCNQEIAQAMLFAETSF